MQRLFFLIILSFITFSCSSGENNKNEETKNQSNAAVQAEHSYQYDLAVKGDGSFTVSGTIKGAGGRKATLQMFPVFTAGRNQKVESLGVADLDENGHFEIPGKVDHKTFGALLLDNNHVIYLILDGSNLEIEADYNDFANYTVNGNKENYLIRNYFNNLRDLVNEINSVRMAAQQAQKSGNAEEAARLKEEEGAKVDAYFSYVKNFADTTSSPLMALFATGMLEPSLYGDFMQEMVTRYKDIAQNSPYYQRVAKLAQGQNGLIGQMAPEIRLPNPEGDTIALSDLRGKYVLLDFWAAWCGPCRRENPNVVKLYKKYKDKNFTVFSVSLDKSKNSWIQAIEKDGLEWPNHVSELAYWNTEAAKPYGVRSIPATFLIDPEGRIIAKDLRGYMLEKKLEQLLGD